jgi:hypothetical protein
MEYTLGEILSHNAQNARIHNTQVLFDKLVQKLHAHAELGAHSVRCVIYDNRAKDIPTRDISISTRLSRIDMNILMGLLHSNNVNATLVEKLRTNTIEVIDIALINDHAMTH